VAILVEGGLSLVPFSSVQRTLRLFRYTDASAPVFRDTPPVRSDTQDTTLLSDTRTTETPCATPMKHEPTVSTVVLRVTTAFRVRDAPSRSTNKRREQGAAQPGGDLDQLRALLYSRGISEDALIRAFA